MFEKINFLFKKNQKNNRSQVIQDYINYELNGLNFEELEIVKELPDHK